MTDSIRAHGPRRSNRASLGRVLEDFAPSRVNLQGAMRKTVGETPVLLMRRNSSSKTENWKYTFVLNFA
jgi:hypothetical protein